MRKNLFNLADFGRVLLLLSACFSFAFPSAFSQDRPQQGTSTAAAGAADHVRAFAFDVVSIRPSDAGSQMMLEIRTGGDEYRALGMPLANTILWAYFPFRLHSKNRLAGAPNWVWNDKFDFVGKVGGADLPEWQKVTKHGLWSLNPMVQSMLQAALADRCKFAAHRIAAQVDGYALVVVKQQPNWKNLIAAKPDDVIPSEAQKIPEDGRMIPIMSPDEPVARFFQTSMASLAATMSAWGGPVDDRTGLTGTYNFSLTRLSTEGIPAVDWDLAPLGLKLVPIKLPTETVVIDHIERPSPN